MSGKAARAHISGTFKFETSMYLQVCKTRVTSKILKKQRNRQNIKCHKLCYMQ